MQKASRVGSGGRWHGLVFNRILNRSAREKTAFLFAGYPRLVVQNYPGQFTIAANAANEKKAAMMITSFIKLTVAQ
jgi:hypothetical protein